MSSDHLEIDYFLQAWVTELRRAMEISSGQMSEITYSRVSAICIPESKSALWLKQNFVESGRFETWVGAQEATWTVLGQSLGEGSGETLRATYLEILNRAQQGTVCAINANSGTEIHCEAPETLTAATFDMEKFAAFEIGFPGAGIPAISLAIELSAIDILKLSPIAKGAEAVPESPHEEHLPAILANLRTLKLPVSISIGQRDLEMKKALSTGLGSLILLNKEVTEPVDLLIQGRVVARGEIVEVKGNFGFRVKNIVSREELLKMCKGSTAAIRLHE